MRFEELKVGDDIYIIETNPYSLIKFEIIKIIKSSRNIKLKGDDLTFEISFDGSNIEYSFKDRDKAQATLLRLIQDHLNHILKSSTDNLISNYIELNEMINTAKIKYPEIFI